MNPNNYGNTLHTNYFLLFDCSDYFTMPYYYLIRRIQSKATYPLCQIVAFNTNRDRLCDFRDQVVASVAVPPGTSYSIEEHPSNLSNRDLHQIYVKMLHNAEEQEARAAEEAYRRQVAAEEAERREQNEQYLMMNGEDVPRKATIVH